MITIWFSRASHPIAQSNVGSSPFTAFFSSLRDSSPFVLSASQIAPAVLFDHRADIHSVPPRLTVSD